MRYPFEIIDKAKKSTEQTKIVQQSYHGTLRNEKGHSKNIITSALQKIKQQKMAKYQNLKQR